MTITESIFYFIARHSWAIFKTRNGGMGKWGNGGMGMGNGGVGTGNGERGTGNL